MTEGYVNIGDSIIFVTSILFGPISGMIAGGFGSALADILTGYSHWALFTLLIKGFEGYIDWYYCKRKYKFNKKYFSYIIGCNNYGKWIFISRYIFTR